MGALLFLASNTGPDIAQAVSMLTRHFETPCKRHLIEAKRVFRYLKGSNELELIYNWGNCDDPRRIEAWTDANWMAPRTTRGDVLKIGYGSSVNTVNW